MPDSLLEIDSYKSIRDESHISGYIYAQAGRLLNRESEIVSQSQKQRRELNSF